MFEGTFTWKKYTVHIKHSGHYYHSNSKSLEITYLDDNEDEQEADEETYTAFEELYKNICKELEDFGYKFIEDEDSEQSFIDACEANEYTFEIDGTMNNL